MDQFDEIEKAWERLELLPAEAFGQLDDPRTLYLSTRSLSDNVVEGREIELLIVERSSEATSV